MPLDDSWLKRDGLLGGRFQVDSLIKTGKYSAVYRMVDTRDNKPWILRVYIGASEPHEQAEFQQAFSPQWAKITMLSNPRLPTIMDAFSLEGNTYILRELVEGKSVLEYIESPDPLDESLIRDWGGQLCDLVYMLHAGGIHLGVIRPNDVYILPDGTLKLADYGPLVFWPATRRKLMVKEWLGGMVPPEVAKGGEVRLGSDVYAIGALLHYTLTRIKPRTHASPFTMLAKHREDVSRDFNRVIMRCLSFSPDGRFDDARALKVALLGEAGPMGTALAAVAAAMQATPPQLLFLDIEARTRPVQKLTITTAGPDDRVSLVPNHPWMVVSPDQIQGERGEVLVSVDPRELSLEGPSQSEIIVAGQRGNISVPVQASLRPTGLAKSGPGLVIALVLLLPTLLASATLGLHGFLHLKVLTMVASTGKQHYLDLQDAQKLASGFAIWLLLQPLLMPFASVLIFQQVPLKNRDKVFPFFALSLLEPFMLPALTVSAAAPIKNNTISNLMNGHVYLVPYMVLCLASALMCSDVGWLHRLPPAVRRPVALVTRAASGISFLFALVELVK